MFVDLFYAYIINWLNDYVDSAGKKSECVYKLN